MTKRKRVAIFFILAVLFLIIAPATVMYCLGWRFDWNDKKIIQPGMFYFKALPKTTEIYLDGKLQKRTDLFFGSVLIENLMPKEYDIEIKKEGYHSWFKKLSISKRQVTEAKNIILVPQNPGISYISKNIESYFVSDDKKTIILKESESSEENLKKWSLKMLNTDKNIKSHLISQDDLGSKIIAPKGKSVPEEIELFNLSFSEDNQRILLEIKVKEKISYFILNLKNFEITALGFLNKNPEQVILHPREENKVFIVLAAEKTNKPVKQLLEFNIEKKVFSEPLVENMVALDISDKNIYWMDSEGFLFKSSLFTENIEKLNILRIDVKKEADYNLFAKEAVMLLEENNSLYLFNTKTLSFEKLIDGYKGFKLSPYSKELLYYSDYELWVTFLEKKHEQPQKEAGEKVLISRLSEPIREAFWYTNNYLIFSIGNKIKISEIDDRSQLNTVDLIEIENPDILWTNNKLYMFSKQSLYFSENLIP